ncbi:glucose dehydrogenase [Cellvibrio zantedeschiae]|uniref:Glucose dehydrogenase n=1 Tax=Cellvibrio zantedeschiae TaxID=1237077 RepID=A0ABQ3BA99_9GAMM|nr:HEAT repeat domain-containing protein [Cellvibrio zantedeschiae]GGY85758.1 glucose dehydrogenase [Cellvibrio zantedeschiae]
MKQKILAVLFSHRALGPSVFVSLALMSGCSGKAPGAQVNPASATANALEITRISPKEAAQTAKEIEQQANLHLAPGLSATLWASEKLLSDTVAINVDDKGRVWAAITERSNNSEFDIRGYPKWEQPSMKFTTVEDRSKFLREELAPEKSAQNTKFPDRNKDGSHDWRDLAVVQERVVRLEDKSGSGRADTAQTVIRDFNTEVTDVAGGLYYHNQTDELFLNVAPDLWSLKDTNGDGTMDTKKSLATGFGVHIGFSGHGFSGAILGPDGRIYSNMGDVGSSITDSTGKKWHYPNQGVIVRSEIDGSNFEVFAAGLRNTHEFSFDKFGNLISVDNDGDHVGEYERIVYLIDGSDSGWRTNWQLGKYKDPKNNTYKVWMDESYYKPRFEGQAAHVLPPIAPYHAGPAGMTYNPGTALSDKWLDHFFVVEFVGSPARAGVNAFTLKPEGASFKLDTDQNVFRGILATGIDFGPDGALYMSDWVEGWNLKEKGRIWKLDTPETTSNAARKDTQARLAENFGSLSLSKLTALLSHADMRVRTKAQLELVTRKATQQLQAVAKDSKDQLARIHALWGLGQLARKDQAQVAALMPFLSDKDAEIRAQAAKLLGDAKAVNATNNLLPLLADSNLRVQFFAAQALGRLGAESAITPIVAMLAANNDKDVYLRQAGAIALARIGNQDALAKLASHPSEAVRIAAVVALKRLESPALAQFLNDSSEFVVTNAARAISDDNFVTDALPALAKLLDAPRFTNEPFLRRVINANLYATGANNSAENSSRLVRFAQQKNIDATLRAEAINTLSVWAKSSDFDRVTGQNRGAAIHDAKDAQRALASAYKNLLADKDGKFRAATINALAEFNVKETNDNLIKILSQDSDPAVRIAALNALKKFNVSDMSKVTFAAMKDKDQSVRMSALRLLPELNLPVQQVVSMHELLLQNGTVGEQQAAYTSLANVKSPEATAVFKQQLQKLIAGKIAREVQLDLIFAAEKMDSAELKQIVATYEASKNANDPLEVYRESLMGGNAMEGRNLFRFSDMAQCVRCHMVGVNGARVGPELTTIASRISREQMLEALVSPSARIAPGFGQITAVLKTGERIEGTFDAETESTITISSKDKTHKLNRTDIAKIETSTSGMPPMNLLLDRMQIRNLVAYLSTLKAETIEGH